MRGSHGFSPADPAWRAEILAWAEAALAARGARLGGPAEQPHVRPWATVLRLPTDAGACFLKAVAPALAHEPAVAALVARARPAAAPPLLAVDLGRGWMLMADGGARLRDIFAAAPDLARWARVLAEYAELQIGLAGRVDELLALGAPDRRPGRLPGLYAELLDDPEALGGPAALSAAEMAGLRALAPALADDCALLASGPIAASLHHGDLHDGNVFVDGQSYCFFDWGDCSVAHPFVGLRTPQVSVENTFDLDEDAPEMAWLRDAFLEPWTHLAPRSAIGPLFAAGARLAPLVSVLSWRRSILALPADERADYRHVIPSLLRELLELFSSQF